MALVAGTLIDAARDEHPTFDDRRHPSKILLRALSRYQRSLVAEIVQRNRTVMVTVQETALPLASFDAGITLPAYRYPAAVEVEGPAGGGATAQKYKVELVSWTSRLRYHLAAYIRDGVLYLTGSDTDWVGFTKVRFFYVPDVTDLTALADTLTVPDEAESCLQAYLCAFMAKRGSRDEAQERPDVGVFTRDWERAELRFLDDMAQHTIAHTGVIREAF